MLSPTNCFELSIPKFDTHRQLNSVNVLIFVSLTNVFFSFRYVRLAEMDARGFHEYVFDGLQPDFQWPSVKFKRNYYPQGITSRGFSDDIFHQSFGMFEPLKRYEDKIKYANTVKKNYFFPRSFYLQSSNYLLITCSIDAISRPSYIIFRYLFSMLIYMFF